MELWFPGSYFEFYIIVSINIFISGLFIIFYRNSLKHYYFIKFAKKNGAVWKSEQNYSVVWILVFIVIYPVGYVGGCSALNYNGYCFNQSKILSEEEQIKPVVKEILEDYPNIRFAYDELPSVGNYILKFSGDEFPWISSVTEKQGVAKINANKLIPYKTMDEYFAINPECCNFTQQGLYGPIWGISFVDKISGEGAGFVNIKYKVRYFDEQGKMCVKWQAFTAKKTNCGISVWR